MWRFFHFHGWVLRVLHKVVKVRHNTHLAFQSIRSILRQTQPNPLHKPQIHTFGHTTCSDLSSRSKFSFFGPSNRSTALMPEPGRWNGRGPILRTTSSRRFDSKCANRNTEIHTVLSTQYFLIFAQIVR